MNEPNKITAQLKEIEYTPKLSTSLEIFDIKDLVCEQLSTKSSFILALDKEEYAISQWLTPKRTRSFPFARVYDTLCRKTRVTLIPFCKDEGADGDRDFIQWDTVSLMSLLNVHVIVCYYYKAEKSVRPNQEHKHKITKQILDYDYVKRKLDELKNYQSSALHWNQKQMEELSLVGDLTLKSYRNISDQTGVRLHGYAGIDKRIQETKGSASEFKKRSRDLSETAQWRESLTDQPKEKTIGTKATVTLTNLLGGEYHWTADEYFVLNGRVFLVEKKHSANKLLPSSNDIKDALIKLALFSNISDLQIDSTKMLHYSAVGLTSDIVLGTLHSNMDDKSIEEFFLKNDMKRKNKNLILSAVNEAKCNGFGLFILNAKDTADKQTNILKQLIV